MSEQTGNLLRTPWRESAITQIWDVTTLMRSVATEHTADDASLRVWLIHAPWMAPLCAWHWHYVGVIHLRNLPGQSKPPHLAFPEATHELIAMAVDPATPIDINAAKLVEFKFLSPASVCQQFVATNDAEALARVEEGLELAVAGQMTLESDGRKSWQEFLLGRPRSMEVSQ